MEFLRQHYAEFTPFEETMARLADLTSEGR
jgi:hypothetical protein